MSRSILDDAFAHHTWASLRLIDACLALSPAHLATTVPGTYGSILDTFRHLVGSDRNYLVVLSGGRVAAMDEDTMDLPALRDAMAADGPVWAWVVEQELDADRVILRRRADGSTTTAPLGIRLAQVVHHGTDHRSQICTALTSLGIEPPAIDVWDYADATGRMQETPPTA